MNMPYPNVGSMDINDMKIYGGMKKIPSKMHYYLNKKDLFKGI
jgi:hypothetical protein